MLVFGCVLLVTFALFEKYLAPKTFIPLKLLMGPHRPRRKDLIRRPFVEFYIRDSCFTSFLQGVKNLTITPTTYVANIYPNGSCSWALVVGALIRWSGRFKWLALYSGVPLTILGVGLMTAFRQPAVNIGFINICQIFMAFSGETLVICEEIGAMAAVSSQYIAVILGVVVLQHRRRYRLQPRKELDPRTPHVGRMDRVSAGYFENPLAQGAAVAGLTRRQNGHGMIYAIGSQFYEGKLVRVQLRGYGRKLHGTGLVDWIPSSGTDHRPISRSSLKLRNAVDCKVDKARQESRGAETLCARSG